MTNAKQYLDQNNPQAAPSAANAPAAAVAPPPNQYSPGGVANWVAGMAGVDPTNPTQPPPQPTDRLPGLVSNQPMRDWPFPPKLFGRR